MSKISTKRATKRKPAAKRTGLKRIKPPAQLGMAAIRRKKKKLGRSPLLSIHGGDKNAAGVG